MKNKIFMLFVTLLLISFTNTSHAKTSKIISLKDGSQIVGQIIKFENGIYTIETATFGQIEINDSEIINISSKTQNPQKNIANINGATGELDGQVQQLQGALMSNPSFINEIQQIAQDPEIIELISDPSLMNKLTNPDAETLKNDPKMKEIMANPKINKLIKMTREMIKDNQ